MTPTKPRIVILGGGFGGVAAAQELARVLPAGSAEVELVSQDNYLLFHPMLPEVAGAGIEPGHILSPLRLMCRNTRIVEALVHQIDLENRVLIAEYGSRDTHLRIPFDYLVL